MSTGPSSSSISVVIALLRSKGGGRASTWLNRGASSQSDEALCRAGGARSGRNERADDPEEREEDPDPEEGGVALPKRRHAEEEPGRQVQHTEKNPEERHVSPFRARVGCFTTSSRSSAG